MKNKLFIFIIIFSFFFLFFQKYVLVCRINSFSVVGKYGEVVSWFQTGDNDYTFFLPKNINRSNLKIEIKTNFNNVHVSVSKDKYRSSPLLLCSVTDIFLYDEFDLFVYKKGLKKQQYHIYVMQSDLPSVFIEIDGGKNSYNKIISDKKHLTSFSGNALFFNSNQEMVNYKIKKIRGRGNSTWLRPKKSFQIKFQSPVSLFDIPNTKKYLLIANHWDFTLSRNYLWFQLAKNLGMKNIADIVPIDLYINGDYLGNYLFSNKVDSYFEKTNSCLLEITNTLSFHFRLSHGYYISIRYPYIDKMSDSHQLLLKNEFREMLNKIEQKIYDDKVSLEELEKYIDLTSFITYYWIEEFSLNYDASRGSNYMYLENGKLFMGPIWDMDNTMNRSYYYADYDEDYIFENTLLQSRIFENWFAELRKKDGFSELIQDYFSRNVEVFENLPIYLDNYHEYIKNSAEMNFKRWPYSNIKEEQVRKWVVGNDDYESSYQLLKKGIFLRLNYFKNKYSIE